MPLTGRSLCHDRSEVIRKRFDERRRFQLRAALTPQIEEEFRVDVEGRRSRSLALRQLLNFIRMSPIEGRPFAYAAPPYREYFLARLHAGRGIPPSIDVSRGYASKQEAIFAVFQTRLADLQVAISKDGGVR
jgi:hypothetical protein